MYVYYNGNPDNNLVGDCVVRAVCTLMNQSWVKTFIDICIQGLLMYDMPSSNAVWGAYLYKNGYRRHIAPDIYPNIYTIKRFCEDNPQGSFLICTDQHVVVVIDGNYYDTMDCGQEAVLYYWRKEE
jgi:hypothetical protein